MSSETLVRTLTLAHLNATLCYTCYNAVAETEGCRIFGSIPGMIWQVVRTLLFHLNEF